MSELQALAGELGIGERVHWQGQVDDDVLGSMLGRAWLVCFRAVRRLGLALVEAMASGCNVLASNLPTHREILGEELAGQVVDFADPTVSERLASEIRLPLSTVTSREQAVRTRSEHFSIDRLVEEFEAFYREPALIPGPDADSLASVDRRLTRNATWLLAAQVVTLASGLAILVAIGRLLTPEELGRWRFAQAVLAFLLVLADTGLTSFAIRKSARRTTAVSTFGWTMLLLRLSLAAASLAAVVLTLALVGQSQDAILVTAIMGATSLAVSLSASYILQGREDFRLVAAIRITSQLVGAGAAVAGIFLTGSLPLAAGAMLLAAVLATLITDRAVARTGDLGRRLSFSMAIAFLRGATPFIGAGLAVMVIFNADAFLIQLFRGDRELGFYAAPYAIAAYSLVIGGALMGAAFPRLARVAQPVTPNLFIGELAAAMGSLSLPIAVGGIVTAEPLLATLFGPAYAESWPVLVVLMSLPFFGFLNMTLGQSMAATGQQRGVFITAVLAASANVALNVVFIPWLGISAQAIVAAMTEIVTLVLYTSLASTSGIRVPISDYLGSLPAALLMGAAVLAVRATGVDALALLLVVGVGTYVGDPGHTAQPRRPRLASGGDPADGQGHRVDFLGPHDTEGWSCATWRELAKV